nr:ATP-binding protein [bacterium]
MILDTILNEKILFIDEVESNLHIHILRNVFNLIHSNLERKYQFICTTHSTELMDL